MTEAISHAGRISVITFRNYGMLKKMNSFDN